MNIKFISTTALLGLLSAASAATDAMAGEATRPFPFAVMSAAPEDSAPGPRHGVWVDLKVLQMDKKTIARYVLLAKQAGLTHLYPAVFRYGCNFYSAPKSPFDCGNEDLLGKFTAIVRETAPEMQVTPWFERTIHMGALTPRSLYNNTSVQEAANAQVDGYRVVDIDNTAVREHMLQSILALRAYGIHSVQIDDHLAYDVSSAHQHNDAFKANPELWKAKLTRFVNWLTDEVHKQAPNFRVEIAQNPQAFAEKTYLADWKNWDVDEVVVECYRTTGMMAAHDPSCGNGRRGVAFLANNTELSDNEILTAARGLKDKGFILFHLGPLANKTELAKKLGEVLKAK